MKSSFYYQGHHKQIAAAIKDALAADRLLGESSLETFAFRDFSKGKAEEERKWQARNATPILCFVQSVP